MSRYRHTRILPATPGSWDHPSLLEPHAFWSGQEVGRLYADLATQVPDRTITPYSAVASAELTVVLMRAIRWLEQTNDPAALAEVVEPWLETAQASVEKRIRFGQFGEAEDDVDAR